MTGRSTHSTCSCVPGPEQSVACLVWLDGSELPLLGLPAHPEPAHSTTLWPEVFMGLHPATQPPARLGTSWSLAEGAILSRTWFTVPRRGRGGAGSAVTRHVVPGTVPARCSFCAARALLEGAIHFPLCCTLLGGSFQLQKVPLVMEEERVAHQEIRWGRSLPGCRFPPAHSPAPPPPVSQSRNSSQPQ